MAILTLICAASGLMPTVSAPIEPKELLSKMRDAYHKVSEAYLEVQAKHPAVQGSLVGQPMKVSYKKPNSIRIELNLANGSTFKSVSDGKTVSLSKPDASPMQVDANDQNVFGGFPLNLEVMSFLRADKELSTEKGANMETSKLTVTEKDGRYLLHEEAPAQQVVVDYEVDKKTMLIMKTTVKLEGKKEVFAEFTVVKMDLKPKFAKDHFDLPKQ
ncbi:MAG: hypothetical protein KF784_06460 [Fimbriimonadaceae bacterium]|nr:hypothetical protein [Fimbriimonadaceae bacterium]